MNNLFRIKESPISDSKDIEVLKSRNGLPIAKAGGFYLNSQYDPIKEGKQFADLHYKKNYAHVLFGLGFSYTAIELLKKMDEKDFLLIIEPNVALFEEVKKSGFLEPLMNHSQVFFLIGYDEQQIEEEIKYLVGISYTAQIQFIVTPNYNKLYPEYIKRTGEIVVKNIKLSIMNIATIAVFSKIWQDNVFYNLSRTWEAQPFKLYESRFSCPVIIAASGPSLTKQLPYLKKVRERESALIIAAGSTINPLLKAGIKPHIVVSIDGGEANWIHFKEADYDDVALFYSLAVHKDIPKHHKGLKVVFNSGDEAMSAWINQLAGKNLGFVVGGASVANFSFYIAKKISSGPIAFIGQDLAYTDNQSHAKGNKHHKNVSESSFEDKNKYTIAKGYYGEEVVTDYQFLSMKRIFEDMIIAFRKFGDERPMYNCTEGGAYIEKFSNIPFKEFVESFCGITFAAEFNLAFKQGLPDWQQKEQVMEALKQERDSLQDVKKLADKAIESLSRQSKETAFIEPKVLKKLDKLDEQLNEHLKSNSIHYIIMPVTFRVNHLFQEQSDETQLETKMRILNKSEALYKGIKEAVEATLTILDDILSEEEQNHE